MNTINKEKLPFSIGDTIYTENGKAVIKAYYFKGGFNNYSEDYGYTLYFYASFNKQCSEYSYDTHGHQLSFEKQTYLYFSVKNRKEVSGLFKS